MAELGHNYNIQNMKLFQELKSSFPNVPDSVVRQFMKQNRNDMKKCMEELAKESEKYSKGRYGIRNEEHSGKKTRIRPLSLTPTLDNEMGSPWNQPRDQGGTSSTVRRTKDQGSSVDTIPTVVLTPDSPPQQSPTGTRKVQTLYTPNDAKVETTVIESHDVFFPQQSLEQELRKSLATSNNIDDDGVIICGSNDTISKSYIDIVPDINSINLPFGSTTHSQEDLLRTNQDASTPLSDINISVSKSTTSVTQGKVHVVKDIGNGTISIATTTFCGISHSVMSTASQEGTKPNTRCKTVLYTINRKPIICENPFRKVFARRKEFYQSREDRDKTSPETSSKKLIWRHSNHNCRRLTNCPPRPPVSPSPSPIPVSQYTLPPPENHSNFFTLNANIEPFDPFIIKHDISRGLDPNRNSTSPLCSAVNLTLCPQDSRDNSPPVEVLPDGSGLKYQSKVEEDGCEAHLEVRVNLGGSTITTKRTGKSEISSNEISVKLVGGGGQVNIQQSQTKERQPPPERPSSLHLPPRYATSRHAHSLYQGRGTSPQSLPRYNSLPSFKTLAHSANTAWDYQSHPKDDEKRIAYTRALLSHQMDQLLKLSKELTDGKQEVDGIKENIKSMEKELKKQEIMMKAHAPKLVHVEVKQLETAIDNLRGDCDEMSKKVTHLTAGKVPLGETSINFENYLTNITTTTANNQLSLQVPETISSRDSGAFTNHPSDIPDTRDISGGQDTDTCEAGKWSCSECTFANHPSLDTCEICEMPRINLGTNNQPLPSVGCFCHPQDHSRTCHLDQEHYQDKPARVFSDPKYGDDRKPKQRTVENTKHNTNCPNTSTKKQS